MKSIVFGIILSATVLTLGACTAATDGVDPDEPAGQKAIAFGAYAGKFVQTRAGVAGNLGLQDLRNTGFGVLAYSTGVNKYAEGAYQPNFMYNDRIADEKNTGTWSYSPLRYWPNKTIDANGNEVNQYVSFFAYAPYANLSSGNITTGITALTANTSTSAPMVNYSLGTNGDNVDLLWGSNDGNSAILDRTEANGNVRFFFTHALTKVGGTQQTEDKQAGLTIVLDADNKGIIAGSNINLPNTKVTIRKITLEQIGLQDTLTGETNLNVYKSGEFNLLTGEWTVSNNDLAAVDTTDRKLSPFIHTIVVADSVKAKNANGSLNPMIAEPTADKYVDDAMIGKRLRWDSIPQGLTTTEQNVYQTEYTPMLVIPAGGYKPVMRLSVSYVVRTVDTWLATGHTEVAETLTRTFTLSNVPTPAHRFHITIHLGLHYMTLNGNLEEWQVSKGSIIHDRTTRQDNQGPDMHDHNPSGQDTTWMAKKNIWQEE